MTSQKPLIVVGFDGSDSSRAALKIGATRAGGSGRLVIVHAYALPRDFVGTPYYQNLLDDLVMQAQNTLEALNGAPELEGVEWSTDLIGGPAAEAIAAAASTRSADEIVIGTRGFGRARALLGSVAHELLHLADCPVTVVPERALERIAKAPIREEAATP